MFARYEPNRPTRQHCRCCDTLVDSEHCLTGDFYTIYGYGRNTVRKDHSGDYTSVMIAICMNCQEKIKTGKISILG